jgi:hypothetical protein
MDSENVDAVAGGEQPKALSVLLREARRKLKIQQLKKAAKAAERKALRSRRVLKEESWKHAKHKVTIRSYFQASRNTDNNADLDQIQGCSNRPDLERKARQRKRVRELTKKNEVEGLPDIAALGLNLSEAAVSVDTDGAAMQDVADVDVELSIPAVLLVSSESSAYIHSEDDPTFHDFSTCPYSDSSFDTTSDKDSELDGDDCIDELHLPGRKRKRPVSRKSESGGVTGRTASKREWRKRYDVTRKYQQEWAAKAPWSEQILKDDGLIHQVRCRPCSTVGRKEVVMAPKWDTIQKHGVRDSHKQKMILYASRQPNSVLEQMQGCNRVESKKKRIQFATLFALLSAGRPMSEFEARFELYEFLAVPNLPRMHWSLGSGWIMGEHMYDFVKRRQREIIKAADFIAVSADETSCVDLSSVIVIHVYVMSFWSRQAHMLALLKMEPDGATADSLTKLLIGALTVQGDLSAEEIASKLLCFGADGVATFQGTRNGVTKQIKQNHAPFMIGIHCFAHRLQLCAKSLSSLHVLGCIEALLLHSHSYFSHSPKRAVEFHALAQLMETKGLKLLKNVKTRWISCHQPLRRLLGEYKSVMAKMWADKDDKKSGRKARVSVEIH